MMKQDNLLTPFEQARAKRLAYQRKYYRLHKAKARRYYRANQEKIKERAAQWRADNRKRYLIQQAMYDLTQRGKMYPEDRIIRAYHWIYKAREE